MAFVFYFQNECRKKSCGEIAKTSTKMLHDLKQEQKRQKE
jgi:hypothetical protein